MISKGKVSAGLQFFGALGWIELWGSIPPRLPSHPTPLEVAHAAYFCKGVVSLTVLKIQRQKWTGGILPHLPGAPNSISVGVLPRLCCGNYS